MKIESWQLKQRQSLSLDLKIKMTKRRIREWYDYWKGEVYIGFSGGKDSTVLLNLVRSMYPGVEAVFVNTGLQFPEVRKFIKEFDNVTVLRPKMCHTEVLTKYGYPIISKSVSMAISRYRNTKFPLQKKLRLSGGFNPNTGRTQKMGVIPKKWHYLIDAPFKISEQCCYAMKKEPFARFEKKKELKPFIGIMADESNSRKMQYMKEGCNVFEGHYKSQPLSFWLEQDIWNHIRKNEIPYCQIYNMGIKGTGCIYCMFGCHLEKEPNRFQMLEKTHPTYHNYCINKLGMGKILDYIKVPYTKTNKELLTVLPSMG